MKDSVLILTPFFSPGTGGVETHLDDLICFLQSKKGNFFVLTYRPITSERLVPYEPREQKGNVTIIRKWWPGGDLFHRLEKNRLLQFLYTCSGLMIYTFTFMLFHHKQIAVIHAHGLNASLIARFMSFFFPARLVASTHALYNFRENSLIAKVVNWTFKRFDRVHALSDASRFELKKIGINSNIVTTTYHWVRAETFRPLQRKSEPAISAIFVGRLYEKKGVDIIQRLSERFPKIRFIVIGDGPLSNKLKIFSEHQNNFHFPGRVENARVAHYLSEADFLIIPSQYEEALGRVIIEALYCGLPVIGTNIGAIPEVVDRSVGILTDGTLAGFEEAIRQLTAGNTLQEFKKNTIAYAHRVFGMENAEKIYLSYGLNFGKVFK